MTRLSPLGNRAITFGLSQLRVRDCRKRERERERPGSKFKRTVISKVRDESLISAGSFDSCCVTEVPIKKIIITTAYILAMNKR